MNYPTPIIPGQVIGNWRVLVADGRRITCICVCGTVRILAADAIITGTVTNSCGCRKVPEENLAFLRAAYDARQRRREMQRWKPKS